MPHIGYILLCHGPKHTGLPLEQRPGAGPQMRAITSLAERLGHSVDVWRFDYHRMPKGPASYPTLFSLLGRAREVDARGLIVIQDVMRLFRRLPADAPLEMFEALYPYRSYVIDARQMRPLTKLSSAEWATVLKLAVGRNRPAKEESRPQAAKDSASTERARRMSRISRTRTADEMARKILNLRHELSAAGAAPGNAALARIANARGLRTSRGKPWSDVAVRRALERLSATEDGA